MEIPLFIIFLPEPLIPKKIPKLIFLSLGIYLLSKLPSGGLAGLLTRGSPYFPHLPMPFRPLGLRHSGSLRVSSPHTAAGPCQNHTGFPFKALMQPPTTHLIMPFLLHILKLFVKAKIESRESTEDSHKILFFGFSVKGRDLALTTGLDF